MHQRISRILGVVSFSLISVFSVAQAHEDHDHSIDEHFPWVQDDLEFMTPGDAVEAFACTKASNAQIVPILEGNKKKNAFLQYCSKSTGGSAWCNQLIRPNPNSVASFRCTYGPDQVHQLIHPDENTWVYAAQAVRLVDRLEGLGVKVCQIYNWWRPEPYNKNVGGAAGRHPYGTSVDVRFCSMQDMEKAFKNLCQWRKKGELRAIGYYGSTALHFGIGDRSANTWGKACN